MLPLAIAGGVAGLPLASAAAPALAVGVNPPAGLLDGQYVDVTWSGYPPDKGVTLLQCSEAPARAEDCRESYKISRTRSDGTGAATFRVATGEFPQGFSCGAENRCSIGVFWGNFGEPVTFSQGALAPIEFGLELSSCPQLSGEQIAGTGSSSGFQAILRWEAQVCRDPHLLNVQYTVKNSIGGLEDFAAGEADFAASALPLEAEHVADPPDPNTFTYVASTLSGVAFGYTIFDQATGSVVRNLKLTPKLVAEIFTGTLLNPNSDNRDDGIKKLNPTVTFPSRLKAVGRADKAASTYYLTSWFEAVAKESYEGGGDAYKGGPTTIYPSTGNISLVTGGEAVARAVGPQAEADFEVATIGWMDSSWAAFYGIPMAEVANPSGNFVSPASPGALSAGAEAAAAASSGEFPMPDYATDDPKAYPLPMINHFIAAISPPAAKAPVMKSFFNYTLGDGQKALPPGYVALPESVAARSRQAAAKIAARSTAGEVPTSMPGRVRASGGGQEDGQRVDEALADEPAASPDEPFDDAAGGSSGFNDGSSISGGDELTAPPNDPPAAGPSEPAAHPSLIHRIADLAGKVNPLTGSRAWMILPALAIAAALFLVAGPAIGLPAWAGMQPGRRLRDLVVREARR